MIWSSVLILAFQLAPAEPVPSAAPPESPPPRTIEDLSKPLTGAVPQGSYEAGVRGAFSRTQSLQGPLDGTWILKDSAGASLYRLQLVDPGYGGARLEGAWQDLRAGAAAEASGFFAGVARDGVRLTLQMAGSGPAVTLDPRPEGGYAGQLTAEGKTAAVVLVRP